MAKTLFKGFMQVTEGTFEGDAQEGVVYFVRPSAASNFQDGYLFFNGKKYGTAALLGAELRDLIGPLPEGETDIVTFVQGAIQEASHTHSNLNVLEDISAQDVTDWRAAEPNVLEGVQVNGTDLTVDGNKKVNVELPSNTASGTSNGVEVTVAQVSGEVQTVSVTAPDFANTYAGKSATESAISDLNASAHTHDNKALLDTYDQSNSDIADAVSKKHEHSNKSLLDTYDQSNSDLADAVSKKHEHANASVLDGISAEDVTAWGNGQANVLEGVQVNGTDLTVDGNKKVNVELPSNTASGSSNGVEVTVAQVSGEVQTVSVTAPDFANTYAGKSTTESAISNLNASAHTHDNKAELDLIQSGDVAKWNGMASDAEVVVSAYTANPDLTDGMLKTYKIYQGGNLVGTIDIPKDMVVSSGETVTVNDVKYLRLHIANGNDVDIPVSDLAHVYTQGNGVEISNADVISAKVVEANGLSNGANGIAMGLADGSNNGAMSSSDYTKLSGISNGAQVNTLEGVQVNGSDLTPDGNKKVNIELPSNTASGTSNGVEVTVAQVSGEVSTVTVVAPDFANTYAGKSATESAISDLNASAHTHDNKALLDTYTQTEANLADAVSKKHEHSNKSVLDGITAEDVAAWDAAISQVSGSTSVAVSESNGVATVSVNISDDTGNCLEEKADGLFAAIYYDGNDSAMPTPTPE